MAGARKQKRLVCMPEPGRPEPPDGLDKAGRALWRRIIRGLDPAWELDARELILLEKAALIADRMTVLDAAVDEAGALATGSRGQVVVHPAIAESRQLQLVQLRLLSSLEMADPATVRAREPIRSQRARTAANARWHKEALRAVPGG